MGFVRRLRLISAISSGRRDQVDRLIDGGADPCEPGSKGVTPLMVAAAKGHGPVVDPFFDAWVFLTEPAGEFTVYTAYEQ